MGGTTWSRKAGNNSTDIIRMGVREFNNDDYTSVEKGDAKIPVISQGKVSRNSFFRERGLTEFSAPPCLLLSSFPSIQKGLKISYTLFLPKPAKPGPMPCHAEMSKSDGFYFIASGREGAAPTLASIKYDGRSVIIRRARDSAAGRSVHGAKRRA
ncbi:hypothetical protein MPTK1_6g08790 [Marchantia polymorpha subsp. ruderalis]|uniref:Uncharacterized protein n=2 Tax=Marchantia polymorpha TaxID=3197 RepID=A0AAF6BQ07_MARPO|nr:hypothetical protein MARPO_0060s0042 [Marchantia polymorpha]BBN14091.1 hypothetical protein Mp_6g08790 [Marchantia polymorpha subsp. ruderalis]|eukprot:PTQ36954.1 hypothetical protein MARPO_0060s0042 [Marchantia polymorpha]